MGPTSRAAQIGGNKVAFIATIYYINCRILSAMHQILAERCGPRLSMVCCINEWVWHWPLPNEPAGRMSWHNCAKGWILIWGFGRKDILQQQWMVELGSEKGNHKGEGEPELLWKPEMVTSMTACPEELGKAWVLLFVSGFSCASTPEGRVDSELVSRKESKWMRVVTHQCGGRDW